MTLVLALILAPFACALGLFCLRHPVVRALLVGLVTLAVCAGTVALAFIPGDGKLGQIPVDPHALNLGVMALELLMGLFIIYVGIRAKNFWIVLLMAAQAALMGWFEITGGGGAGQGLHLVAANDLFIDNFAIIMALINGLVGGGICIYALGYMKDYHESAHKEVADRRPLFFSLLFVFMGAMFGLIFANNLMYLFLFWEITTLCSYLLIGYTKTDEARRNSQRALVMNLLGGLGFAIAIVMLARSAHTIELQSLINSKTGLLLLPAALLCFAGITKSAQLPFSSWLLGAMVAPTPVSALLHSSTMVKAGVYLVLRMAPVITNTWVGTLVGTVGGITFVIGSLAAITCTDAKRVLAWSTVANLGLIVLCGGVGTYAAVWAGVLLIVFHAVAKCLLFLCVGVVEHKLHSRDIDAMSALIVKMPKVAVMMLIGMAGMFLAPFGMLISKWAVLKAVVDAAPLLSVLVVFGSSATLFFWVKWMGKLLQVVGKPESFIKELHLGEGLSMLGLTIMTFLACVLFPVVSLAFIEPYVFGVYGQTASLTQGNITIMVMMMGLVMLFPFGILLRGKNAKVVDPYLCGANVEDTVTFVGSGGAVETVSMNNYNLRNMLNEQWLMRWGVIFCTAALAVMVVIACR